MREINRENYIRMGERVSERPILSRRRIAAARVSFSVLR